MSRRRWLEYKLAGHVVGPALAKADRANSAYRRWNKKRKGIVRETPLGPIPETTKLLKEITTAHYFSGRYADGGVPVAWCTSGSPIELLRPLGYHLFYPENHGAICGAGHVSQELIEIAEEANYSQDLCSYARTDFGSLLSGKTPTGRIPKPDLLFCCTNICETVFYWYRELARKLNVPLINIDTPHTYGDWPERAHLEFTKAQMHDAVDIAARVAGKKFDEDAFAEGLLHSQSDSLLWRECLQTNYARPAPWTAFDGFIHMIPIVALRGTDQCTHYYETLLKELKQRAADGIGGIKTEKHRLLWDNLPMWFGMRNLSTMLAEDGFAMVAATYTNAWAETADIMGTEDPWEGLASAYSMVILNRGLEHRLELIRGMVKEYECDGVLFHSDRSCKPYSVGQLELRDRLAKDGIRSMVLDADHNDPRAYAEGPGENRLKAFMETFET